jgi:F-type H+-transporting ATPase subunit a
MPQISLAAEKIGSVFGFPITNSLLATWVVMAILIVFSLSATRNMTLVPRGIQSIAEMLVGGLYEFFTSVAGKHIKQFFPLIASFFLFIIFANWFGLLPGVGTVGFFEHGDTFVPLLRGSNADLNMTLALAIISIVSIQYFGFKTLGFHYSTRFVNFKGPIDFFLGILEVISQFANILSFAFRLFGNIFAGEVLLTVMAFLMPFIVPLPFMALELFVGFVQALVFSMLTAAFLNVAVSHGAQEHAKHAASVRR